MRNSVDLWRIALESRVMPQRSTVLGLVFYLGLSLLMATILLNIFGELIPPAIAVRIDYNSEGYIAALLLALWIQFVRPRLCGRAWQWPVTIAAALALVALGLLLLNSQLPSRFRTLNEPMLALALVITYVQVRRPLPPRLAVGLSTAVLAVTVTLSRSEYVTLLAELLGLALLVPLALDVIDRGILDPHQPTSRRLRYGWYTLLVLIPTASSLLYHGQVVGGLFGEVIRYQVRLHESFIAILLVQLYFAVGLRRIGRELATEATPEGA
jgi:hypothetical protein